MIRTKRLYEKHNAAFTAEARALGFQVETFVKEYIAKNPKVDLHDLRGVITESVSLAICRAIMNRRQGK